MLNHPVIFLLLVYAFSCLLHFSWSTYMLHNWRMAYARNRSGISQLTRFHPAYGGYWNAATRAPTRADGINARTWDFCPLLNTCTLLLMWMPILAIGVRNAAVKKYFGSERQYRYWLETSL